MKYVLNGQEVTEEEFAASGSRLDELFASGETACGQATEGWPIKSRALAVHPRQVEAASKAAKDAGVPTEFMPDGRPIIRSHQHQREYARTRGMQNHNNFY